MERFLLEPGGSPAKRLARMVHAHLQHVATHSEALLFEAHAYWARNAEARKPVHEWYAWLAAHYADLIHAVRPTLSAAACGERALQVITLCLGAWMTLSQSRPVVTQRAVRKVRQSLQRGVDSLVGAELPWDD